LAFSKIPGKGPRTPLGGGGGEGGKAVGGERGTGGRREKGEKRKAVRRSLGRKAGREYGADERWGGWKGNQGGEMSSLG